MKISACRSTFQEMFLSTLAMLLCAGCSYDKEKRLMTSPAALKPLSATTAALDAAFAGPGSISDAPLVLYVTGRGNEPKKSIEGDTLAKLETNHEIKTLMFIWDSYGFASYRPVPKAEAAGAELRALITAIGNYRKEKHITRPISLLVHSMGNIVLEAAVGNGNEACLKDADGKPIFTNILMTGSDADRSGDDWIGKLVVAPGGSIVVTLNKSDGVLAISENWGGGKPIGHTDGVRLKRVTNAAYVDVTLVVGKMHRLFEVGRLKNHSQAGGVVELVDRMLTGKELKLGELADADPRNANLFLIKPRSIAGSEVAERAQPQDELTDTDD